MNTATATPTVEDRLRVAIGAIEEAEFALALLPPLDASAPPLAQNLRIAIQRLGGMSRALFGQEFHP